MCECKICIHYGTYQESLNHWRKRRLIYINNNSNLSTRGSVEKSNSENIFYRYGHVVLIDREKIHPCAKYATFASMCDFPEKYIKLPK